MKDFVEFYGPSKSVLFSKISCLVLTSATQLGSSMSPTAVSSITKGFNIDLYLSFLVTPRRWLDQVRGCTVGLSLNLLTKILVQPWFERAHPTSSRNPEGGLP